MSSTIQVGYAAQNLTLPETTNRTLRLANITPGRVQEIVGQNLNGLERILHWNAVNGINLFRVGQQVIPFASHPAFPYDWETVHGDVLRRLGSLARDLEIRLSIHPGQYIQPGSPNGDVAARSIEELRYSARLMHLLRAGEGTVVLHLGGAYGDKPLSVERFVAALRPHHDVLEHLVLENDERTWTVAEVVGAATALGIPAIADTLHHRLNPGGISLHEAFDLALPTWRRTPKIHLSSQDPTKNTGAHAYGVHAADWQEMVDALDGREAAVMVEAKGKDRAILQLREDLAALHT